MTTVGSYTARATRGDDGFWLVHVPEIGHYTQARTVAEIETMARDLVAVCGDLNPADVDVEVVIAGPDRA